MSESIKPLDYLNKNLKNFATYLTLVVAMGTASANQNPNEQPELNSQTKPLKSDKVLTKLIPLDINNNNPVILPKVPKVEVINNNENKQSVTDAVTDIKPVELSLSPKADINIVEEVANFNPKSETPNQAKIELTIAPVELIENAKKFYNIVKNNPLMLNDKTLRDQILKTREELLKYPNDPGAVAILDKAKIEASKFGIKE